MVHAIRALGYTCHAVNYLHELHSDKNQVHLPLNSLEKIKSSIFRYLKKRGFYRFDDSICRHSFTTDPEKVPWDDFDVFVVVSDIVWDYEHPGIGRDPDFGMLPQMMGKPVIAYAASTGPANVQGPFPSYVKDGLNRFSAIGVRDEATADRDQRR